MADKKKGVVSETTPSVFGESRLPAMRPESFKPGRKLTLDLISISKLEEVIIGAQGELTVTELPSKFTENGKANAWTLDAFNVMTGEEFMLACNTVLASALRRAGEPLTGRYFAIRVGEIKPGKRYRTVEVVEVFRVE